MESNLQVVNERWNNISSPKCKATSIYSKTGAVGLESQSCLQNEALLLLKSKSLGYK